MATTTYGIKLKVTPSSANNFRADTVLYRADTSIGVKTEVARQRGLTTWYYSDVLPTGDDYFYWIRAEMPNYTSSAYVGPVDCKPTDLGSELET